MVQSVDRSVSRAVKADKELLQLARTGDQEAFDQLWKLHEHSIRISAWQYAHHNFEGVIAETREILAKEILAGLGPSSYFGAYSILVLRATASKWYRNPSSRPTCVNVFEVSDETRADITEHVQTGTRVSAAFAALPLTAQGLLWLTEVEHRDPKQVAKIFKLTRLKLARLKKAAFAMLLNSWIVQHVPANAADFDRVALFPAYLSNSLSKADRAHLQSHLNSCESCRAIMWDLKGTYQGLLRVVASALILTGSGTVAATLKVATLPAAPAAHETGTIVGAPEVLGSVQTVAASAAVGAVGTAATVGAGNAAVAATAAATGKTAPAAIAALSGSVLLAVGVAFTATQIYSPVSLQSSATAAESGEPAETVSFSAPTDESIPRSAKGSTQGESSEVTIYELMPDRSITLASDASADISVPVEKGTDAVDLNRQSHPESSEFESAQPDAPETGPGASTGDGDDTENPPAEGGNQELLVKSSHAVVTKNSELKVTAKGTLKGKAFVSVKVGDTATDPVELKAGDWKFKKDHLALPQPTVDQVTLVFTNSRGKVIYEKSVKIVNAEVPLTPLIPTKKPTEIPSKTPTDAPVDAPAESRAEGQPQEVLHTQPGETLPEIQAESSVEVESETR